MLDGGTEGRRDGQPKSRKAPTFAKRGYNYRLMQVKSITKSLLCLFLRGGLRQVLLYISHLNEGVT